MFLCIDLNSFLMISRSSKFRSFSYCCPVIVERKMKTTAKPRRQPQQPGRIHLPGRHPWSWRNMYHISSGARKNTEKTRQVLKLSLSLEMLTGLEDNLILLFHPRPLYHLTTMKILLRYSQQIPPQIKIFPAKTQADRNVCFHFRHYWNHNLLLPLRSVPAKERGPH